jgi:hypothetical protein
MTYISPEEKIVIELEKYKVEADVLSGRSCLEEQKKGNGPCGICKLCLRERIKYLQKAEDFAIKMKYFFTRAAET